MKRIPVPVIGCSALVLVSCGEPSSMELGRVAEAVLGGEPSDAGEDYVVRLSGGIGEPKSGCSATVIAPNAVLTALHCVSHYAHDKDQVACDAEGALISVPPGGVIGGLVPPESIEIRIGPGYTETPAAFGVEVFGTGSTQICRHDLAVVVLDRDLPVPVASLRLGKHTERGERMRIVGYGENGTEEDARYTRSGVRVTDVGTVDDAPAAGLAAPDTMVLGEGACDGDSGGPAFSDETGAVVGVYSISAGLSCTAVGVRNIYTLVAPFRDLVERALQRAGHEALVEPDEPGIAVDAGTPGGPVLGGSGSRRDPNIACRAAVASPRQARAWPPWIGTCLAALVLSRLRRRS